MKPVTPRSRLRTRHIAVLASVLAHVAVLAVWAAQRRDTPHPKAVVIEFAPSERPEVPTVVRPEQPETEGVAAVEPAADTGPAKQPEAAAPSSRTDLLEAVLAVDLRSLRQPVLTVEDTRAGQPIQTAGVALVEPDIHLTAVQVDSLVAAEPVDDEVRPRKGVRTQQRGVSGCLP